MYQIDRTVEQWLAFLALQPGPAQAVANFKVVSDGGASLPLQSAACTDTGTQHRVVLTVAAGHRVTPDVYHVWVDAPNLTATNGDVGEPRADQLWVDVTGENTLKPITVQPDGRFAVSGSGPFLGYGPPQQVLAGDFAGNGRTDLIVREDESLGGFTVLSTLLLLKNNGDGTYAPPVPVPLGARYQILTLNSVDWNHDGSPDLVVGAGSDWDGYGHTTKYQYLVLLDDGHGNFSDAPDTPIPVADPDPLYHNETPLSATGIYDLDGDGQYEIVHNEGGVNGPVVAEVIGKDRYVGYTPQLEIPFDHPNRSGGVRVRLRRHEWGRQARHPRPARRRERQCHAQHPDRLRHRPRRRGRRVRLLGPARRRRRQLLRLGAQ